MILLLLTSHPSLKCAPQMIPTESNHQQTETTKTTQQRFPLKWLFAFNSNFYIYVFASLHKRFAVISLQQEKVFHTIKANWWGKCILGKRAIMLFYFKWNFCEHALCVFSCFKRRLDIRGEIFWIVFDVEFSTNNFSSNSFKVRRPVLIPVKINIR